MRGLVVLASGLLLASLLVAGWSSAQTTKETTVLKPAEVTCTSGNGTTVTLKANSAIDDLDIAGICKKEHVDAGWTVQCYIGENRDSVDVSFRAPGGRISTRVVCG